MVSNPPFVVGPGTTTHVYRDSGRVGDAIGAELAAAAPGLLTEGGTMQYLANWVHVAGEDWGERVAGWFAGTGLDAWVIQREVADPMAYVNLWLTDVGEAADPQRMAAWLDWFDAHKVEAVGFGIVIAAPRRARPTRWSGWRTCASGSSRRWATRSAPGSTGRTGCAVRDTDGLLAARYRAADGLQLRQEADHGRRGLGGGPAGPGHAARAALDRGDRPAGAGAGRRRDGRLPLRDQLALLAAAHDVAPDELAEAAGPIVAHLVERGIIEPVAG